MHIAEGQSKPVTSSPRDESPWMALYPDYPDQQQLAPAASKPCEVQEWAQVNASQSMPQQPQHHPQFPLLQSAAFCTELFSLKKKIVIIVLFYLIIYLAFCFTASLKPSAQLAGSVEFKPSNLPEFKAPSNLSHPVGVPERAAQTFEPKPRNPLLSALNAPHYTPGEQVFDKAEINVLVSVNSFHLGFSAFPETRCAIGGCSKNGC
jgi:hypothetical protein